MSVLGQCPSAGISESRIYSQCNECSLLQHFGVFTFLGELELSDVILSQINYYRFLLRQHKFPCIFCSLHFYE